MKLDDVSVYLQLWCCMKQGYPRRWAPSRLVANGNVCVCSLREFWSWMHRVYMPCLIVACLFAVYNPNTILKPFSLLCIFPSDPLTLVLPLTLWFSNLWITDGSLIILSDLCESFMWAEGRLSISRTIIGSHLTDRSPQDSALGFAQIRVIFFIIFYWVYPKKRIVDYSGGDNYMSLRLKFSFICLLMNFISWGLFFFEVLHIVIIYAYPQLR